MDSNVKQIQRVQAEIAKKNLELRQFECSIAEDEKEALELIESIIKPNDVVSVGGSMTLFETGVIDWLENNSQIQYLDRYHTDDMHEVFRKSFFADVYLTSTNALTMDGKLLNVDGNGNRVAAMIYGPKKVIVLAGINKLVKDEEAALERIKSIAAPANCVRLNKDTPCTKTGGCMDCLSPQRICASHVKIDRSQTKGRIHVILMMKEAGY